jgi:DNA-binding NarL/FixJ family response regulator
MACSAQSIFLQHLGGFKLEPGYATLSGRSALPVAKIRVVFIRMSPLLRDIVKQAIGSERDMEIAGEFCADSWAERLRALKPEVVIISLARGEGDDVTSRLLEAAPNAKIVALSFDNRSALCCVGRYQKVLVDVSPQAIAEFISGPN